MTIDECCRHFIWGSKSSVKAEEAVMEDTQDARYTLWKTHTMGTVQEALNNLRRGTQQSQSLNNLRNGHSTISQSLNNFRNGHFTI